MRLNKALAQAGVCSRRGADDLIRSGRVTVNGQPADLGTQVHPGQDDIRVDNKPIASPASDTDLYYVLNKPVETVTTVKDPEGRRTVLEILGEEALRRRIFPVGRLDYFSEGLLILTTDGELANRLMHPRWHLPKLYWVTLRGEVQENALTQMRSGMTLAEGERLAPVKARIVGKDPRGTVLEMELIQGVNRQIRRMCRDLGLTILKLVRISQGPLKLGKLPVGKYRPLLPEEVAALRAAVDLR
ncbi:MAG: rRNA pseudouridine synthase [Desulfovibrio sp.]|nr:rRNA pseudouridine synthase [Desulfovibrio sp.]MBI4960563.1 rRNA pseudouridine synthase [Desulfovibrio sp.]